MIVISLEMSDEPQKYRFFNHEPTSFFLPVLNRYGPLSDCNRILIFRSWFSDIPRKISEYLRADFPSDVNMRKIRGFYKILNINNLTLEDVLSFFKKHYFGLRNGPFQGMKSTISHPEIGLIGLRNGQYQKVR